jgi:EAL domain-containing protein (putative c-di-GMP-specific phosphodiesterase class I)
MSSHLPPQNANHLVVADADLDSARLVSEVGARLGFAVTSVTDAAQLHEECARVAPSVIVLDPQSLGATETELLRGLERRHGNSTIIIASVAHAKGTASAEELGLAYGLQVSVSLKKPLTDEALEAALAPQIVSAYRFTEQDLRRAVDRAQLLVHYQPKMCATVRGWKVTGMEALLRWNHPDYGLVHPQDFIGLAEQYGLIGALTDFVLQSGIDQLSEWNRLGPRLDLSVNLSPKLVNELDFPDRMSDFLAARGVAPEQLTLEITESAALEDPRCTFDILSRLRLKGIGVSLDDFGIGYSSLTQLYKLPFSEVKIDRTIGMDLPHTDAARTIVRAIVDLGHNLGIAVCCEGVESAGALEFVHQCGCDYAQGYYLARPMPAQDLARWIMGPNPLTDGAVRLAS